MRSFLPFALLLCLSGIGTTYAQTAFDDPSAAIGGTGGTLVAVEPEVAAGTIPLGSTAQVVVRFRNEATQAITFGAINMYPSSNISVAIALNQCTTAPLQFGGECAIVLAVKALKSGPFTSELLIQHSGRSKLITASIAGEVAVGDKDKGDGGVGEVQAAPAMLDFGKVEASRPTLRTIQLRNITSDILTITGVTLDSPQKEGFNVRTECKELQPGQSCLVSVVWSPALPGPTSGFLVVNHSGTSKIMNIPVQGEYNPAKVEDITEYPQPVPGKGLLVSSAKDITFGDDVDSEAALTITLVNSGDADLKLTGMSLSVATPGLVVDPTGCISGTVLKPSEACALTMRWAPQREGKLITDLRIMHDGTRGVLVLPIRGKATKVTGGGGALASSALLPPSPSAPVAASNVISSGENGVDTQLPGSAGLSLSDVDELNQAMVGDIADVIGRATGKNKAPETVVAVDPAKARIEASAASLVSYVVTSHSINRAIILGPNGSRVITHNKPIVIAGQSWKPSITPAGVDFKAGKKIVSLAFDNSISANQALLTDNSAIMKPDNTTTTSSNTQNNASTGPSEPPPSTGVITQAQEPQGAPLSRFGSTGLPDIFGDKNTATKTSTSVTPANGVTP